MCEQRVGETQQTQRAETSWHGAEWKYMMMSVVYSSFNYILIYTILRLRLSCDPVLFTNLNMLACIVLGYKFSHEAYFYHYISWLFENSSWNSFSLNRWGLTNDAVQLINYYILLHFRLSGSDSQHCRDNLFYCCKVWRFILGTPSSTSKNPIYRLF